MILGEAEGIEDAGGAEPEDWGNGGPATDAIGEEVPAGPDGGTAAVRERGGRYPHRVSRRMRRRNRGGGVHEGRPDQHRGAPPSNSPLSAIFLRKARRSSCRSRKSRSVKRALASLRTSRFLAATWSTCRRSSTWASRAKSPATKSACG